VLAGLVAVRRLGDAGSWQRLVVAGVGILGLGTLALGVLFVPGAAGWQTPVAAVVAALPPLGWLALGSIRGLRVPLVGHVGLAAAALILDVLVGAPWVPGRPCPAS